MFADGLSEGEGSSVVLFGEHFGVNEQAIPRRRTPREIAEQMMVDMEAGRSSDVPEFTIGEDEWEEFWRGRLGLEQL